MPLSKKQPLVVLSGCRLFNILFISVFIINYANTSKPQPEMALLIASSMPGVFSSKSTKT